MNKVIYIITDVNLKKIGTVSLDKGKLKLNIGTKSTIAMSMLAVFNICKRKGYKIFDSKNNLYSKEIHEEYIKDLKKYGIGKYL